MIHMPRYAQFTDQQTSGIQYTVKKVRQYSRPQPGCHSSNSPKPGIIYPVPVPGRFGKNKSRNLVNFFLQCRGRGMYRYGPVPLLSGQISQLWIGAQLKKFKEFGGGRGKKILFQQL